MVLLAIRVPFAGLGRWKESRVLCTKDLRRRSDRVGLEKIDCRLSKAREEIGPEGKILSTKQSAVDRQSSGSRVIVKPFADNFCAVAAVFMP
jgi:hypothetical protein